MNRLIKIVIFTLLVSCGTNEPEPRTKFSPPANQNVPNIVQPRVDYIGQCMWQWATTCRGWLCQVHYNNNRWLMKCNPKVGDL